MEGGAQGESISDETLAGRAIRELVESRLRIGQELRFSIPTCSMAPVLVMGDRVRVRGVPADRLRRGDIVLARDPDGWVAHRLVASEGLGPGRTLYTKGDGCGYADTPRVAEELLGLVVSIKRGPREIRLDGGIARRLGRGLAWLSWQQARVYRGRPRLVRSVELRAYQLLLSAGGWLARSIIGFGSRP